MTSVAIDRATIRDIEQLLPLLESLFSLEQDFSFDADKARRAFTQLINDPARSCVLVARNEERIVGMCSAQLVISTAQGAPSAWVEDVVVDESYHRHGLGRALLDELEQWCSEQGATRMQLVADHDNHSALGFYRHTEWSSTNLTVLKKSVKSWN